MRVGIVLTRDQRQVAATARWAEGRGFDHLACGEHLFFHGRTPNAFVVLAAAAGATERIRLLSALTILPVYPAALATKLVATLDQVSNGRFDFGVGTGCRRQCDLQPRLRTAGGPLFADRDASAGCRSAGRVPRRRRGNGDLRRPRHSEAWRRSVELFAEEVLPAIHDLRPAR